MSRGHPQNSRCLSLGRENACPLARGLPTISSGLIDEAILCQKAKSRDSSYPSDQSHRSEWSTERGGLPADIKDQNLTLTGGVFLNRNRNPGVINPGCID